MADVSVFGLGKVGITLAACLGAAGKRVIGVDVNPGIVDALNARTFTTAEPGVNERYQSLSIDEFEATTDSTRAVAESEVSLIIVPTPSNRLGGFSLRYVLDACDQVGRGMRAKRGRHTVATVSTVLPGSSDRRLIPRLEHASGRRVGEGFGYVYNPAFIALGDVVRGFEEPDYVLLGEADAESGDTLLAVHQAMMRADRPIARMSPVEAEITKIASNTHETMRVSFANMLLSVCSEVPGADVDRITEALAHRMGRRFFRGAVPYGGPCWPRDNRALSVFMDFVGAPSRIPRTIDLFNAEHGEYVLRKILQLAPAGARVGILGLAYKPGTPIVEESFPLKLAQWLMAERRRVIGWDPLAADEVRLVTKGCVRMADTAEDCLRQSDVVVIGNPLAELAAVDWTYAGRATVVDCWRCLPAEVTSRVGSYVPLGRGPDGSVATWLERTTDGRFDLAVN
ncbi:MAG: nucleotide sugar dehydrogenase [Acidobacteria bacterium]|nr:nucleotide sugar dehydrogenase [Acidobacteriota bacterium]